MLRINHVGSRTKLMPSDGKGSNLGIIRILANLKSYKTTGKLVRSKR